jgi:hypothetical protein
VASCATEPKREGLMDFHKKILEWQAAHPNVTWLGWGIVWALVIFLYLRMLLAQVHQTGAT